MTYIRRALALALMVAAMSGVSHAAIDSPEFDPAAIGSAVTLLTGGMLLIGGRRSK